MFPEAWLTQVRPSGIILVNLGFTFAPKLTVTTDHSACGRFTDYAAFMFRRADLSEIAPTVQDIIAAADRDGTTYPAPLPPFLEERSLQCLHHRLPPCAPGHRHSDDGDLYSLSNPATGAWARACPEPGGQATVVHGGPGDLSAEPAGSRRVVGRPRPS